MTFTDPEIASVGLSEAAAREKVIDVVVTSADPAEATSTTFTEARSSWSDGASLAELAAKVA